MNLATSIRTGPAVALLLFLGGHSACAQPVGDFEKDIRPFLKAHCVKCHGERKQASEVRLDDLSVDMDRDGRRWRAVRDQLRHGLMPPARQPQPDDAAVRRVLAWIGHAGGGPAEERPNQGNLVPHEALFGPQPAPAVPPPSRVWRLSPTGYLGWLRDVSRGQPRGIVQPFTLIPERGVKDYAALYAIDEPATEVLVRNAELIVETQTAHEIKAGKVHGKNDSVGEFVKLMEPAIVPSRPQLAAAVQMQFRLAIARTATEDEVERFLRLYETCAKEGDRPAAVKTMLQAVLLRTDALFRSELGTGKADGSGRSLLGPDELARALSLALGDRREPGLFEAARKGELATREQVAAHARRLLYDPRYERPALLRFFREYFEYPKARDVFKERPADRVRHQPEVLIKDTDTLILHIVENDRDVLRELLTTRKTFVNYTTRTNKKTRQQEPAPADPYNPKDRDWRGGVDQVYGFETWPSPQPVELPAGTRLGILMQPSWLVAFGTNFDNDPVRRGRWIRERLLGGTVPDLPIGVAAQVPDEPQRTFRDRLTVTRAEQCWKCHRRMDDLGLPFENFNHYGRFRTTETVLDPAATAENVDKQGKLLGKVYRETRLDTTGRIEDSGDPRLDGPVSDPRELVQRLAGSDRVRQVFVRHVFRFFLGRNETLADARTLQEADRAYVASGGSFKALVLALLTSDSFLYRSTLPESSSRGDSR